MEIEVIAKACHEANRAICRAQGDESIPAWEAAPDWQRASTFTGIETTRGGATPEQQHEAWCADKRAHGWRFGAEKNVEDKTHPCLVPYAELPLEQRVKDHVFGAIVRALDSAP